MVSAPMPEHQLEALASALTAGATHALLTAGNRLVPVVLVFQHASGKVVYQSILDAEQVVPLLREALRQAEVGEDL